MSRNVLISFITLMLVGTGFTAMDYGRRAGAAGGGNEQDEKMRQAAAESIQDIDRSLTSLLEKVNKNERPDDALVQAATETLESAKHYAREFEDKDKATFMLLQSWVYFFEGNVPQSLNWSLRSCKIYEPAKDAWITEALFSMLNDRQPIMPRSPRPQRATQRPIRNNEMAAMAVTAAPLSEPGVLDFNFTGLRGVYLQQQFKRFTLRTLSGEAIEYVPGKDMLCMLFRQQEPPEDENNPQMKPEKTQELVGVTDALGVQKTADIEDQVRYFQMLMDACKEQKEIRFIQIDMSAALEQVDRSGDSKIPTVAAAMPESGASMFSGVNAQQPFLLIVDTEGKTKYAGEAAGFVPAFILTELTGVPVDLTASTTGPLRQQPGIMPEPNMMLLLGLKTPPPLKTAVDPNKPVIDPNAPVVDPNALMQKTQQTRRPEKPDFPTQAIEDQIRAEKLLQSAQMHIEESRKLTMKNPKQGIEDARKVIAEYPNTEYAAKARELLRRVPDRWKKRHNITDEELGY